MRVKQYLSYKNNKRVLEREYNYNNVLIFYNAMSSIKNFKNLIANSFVRTKKIFLRDAKKRNTKRILSNNNFKFLQFVFKQR